MALRIGESFWLLRNGFGDAAPALREPVACDVLVVGGGVCGALIADALARDGHDVIVIDRGEPGMGATAATTALLQYEIDTPLTTLVERLGLARGVRAYQAALEALVRLTDSIESLDEDVHFARRPSVCLASKEDDAAFLASEFALRRQWDLPCDLLDSKAVEARFSFTAPAALWTDVAAEVDPWRLTQALLRRAIAHGARVYGRSEAICVDDMPDHVLVRTAEGAVQAGHVVFAAGHESNHFAEKLPGRLAATFAVVTEPVSDFPGWPERCLIWETARPYLYARTTRDGRVVVGGEDVAIKAALTRDLLQESVFDKLLGRMRDLFPAIPLKGAFAWGGTLCETDDGLPYVGTPDGASERRHFVVGTGGNGIVESAIAADILRLRVQGREHGDAALFGFAR